MSSSCGPGLTGSAILPPADTDTDATSNSSKGGEKTFTPSALDVPASTSGLPCTQTGMHSQAAARTCSDHAEASSCHSRICTIVTLSQGRER